MLTYFLREKCSKASQRFHFDYILLFLSIWHNLCWAETWGRSPNHMGHGPGSEGWQCSRDITWRRETAEFRRDATLWRNLHRDLFSSWKTTKQAVRRSVKQSGPTVNQDQSHAWQLFTVLPSSPSPPPPPVRPPASHLSHPSLVTIIAWRKMIFQNSITQDLIPWSEPKAWTWQQGQAREIFMEQNTIEFCCNALESERKSKAAFHVYSQYMGEMIGKFRTLIQYLSFPPVWQHLNWDDNGTFYSPDYQFPFKGIHHNSHTNNKSSGFLFSFRGVHLICLSDLLITHSHNHKADTEPHNYNCRSTNAVQALPGFPRRLHHRVPPCHEMLFSVFDETKHWHPCGHGFQ